MRTPKLAAVIAEAELRTRRASAFPPRLVRRDDARSYVTAPQLFDQLEAAGWIKPTVDKHRMVLFDLDDLDGCIARLKTGEFPEPAAQSAA